MTLPPRSLRAPAPVMIADPARMGDRVLIPPGAPAPERPPSDRVWTLEGQAFGGAWSARLVPPPGADEALLRAEIEAELALATHLFSPWAPASELSRFNAAPEGFWALSTPFWGLLNAAMDLGDDTNGAFDPTLGALVDLWGFGAPGPRAEADPLPSDAAIAQALALSGWNRLRLHRDARAAYQPGGLGLDLCAIAKGWAADRISARLNRQGATAHLIQVGGLLKGVGVRPDGQPWWIEIGQPEGAPAPRTAAALFGLAFAAAHDHDRAFDHSGRRYAHTLDGRTGRPVDNGLLTVAVFEPSALRADALATALMVMGPQDGLAFAADIGLAAQMVWRGAQGLEEGFSPAYAAMMDAG